MAPSASTRALLGRTLAPAGRSGTVLRSSYCFRSSLCQRPLLTGRAGAGQLRGFHSGPRLQSSASAAASSAESATDATEQPQQITIEDIYARRARDGRLVAGTAAPSDVDAFKTAPNWRALPKARRWDHLISRESASRGPCVLKQAAKYLAKPGMISLGGGLPTAEHFPVAELSLRVPRGLPELGPAAFSEATAQSAAGGVTTTMGKYDAQTGAGEYDLSIALNYGQATGSPQLLRWVTEHTELVCRPPYADWQTTLTVGSTGALEQALRIFGDRARGDTVLTETYSFSTALETAVPMGLHVCGVDVDAEGMRPDSLEHLLAAWDPRQRDGRPKPHLLYTVPSGQNPTGATQSLARRQALYDVCRRHDVFILEDEPYYFLQMPPYVRGAADTAETDEIAAAATHDPEAFLRSLLPTMVSLDVDGRVMRMDSFSKVLVPGSRVGWVTAPAQIIERYQRHSEVASQGPAGISQAVLYQIVESTWGHAGYLNWLAYLQRSYTRRRNIMMAACEDYLPGVVTWDVPRSGMFHWLKVDHTVHPDHGKRSIAELEEDIFNSCIEKGILVARGSWFASEPEKPLGGLYFRATYAAAAPEAIIEAIKRFGDAVRESFRL